MHRYGHYAEGTGSVLKMADIDVRSYCTCYPELTLFSERRAIAWGGCRYDWPFFFSSLHCMRPIVLELILAETHICQRKFYQLLERTKQV